MSNSLQGYHVAHLVSADHDPVLLERIKAYLPSNYRAYWSAGPGYIATSTIVIEGTDDCGWTWDDYVAPRLASGLLFPVLVHPKAGE